MNKPSSLLISMAALICLLPCVSTRTSQTYTGTPNSAETEDEQQRLSQKITRSRALASADFDEDGVPDLISGHAAHEGGILCLYRGNVDSLYPNSPEAQGRKAAGAFTDSPLLSPARLFEVPQVPDFIISGDFDADGHADVVVATRGSKALRLLAGDGRGGFGPTRQVTLPGAVTAITGGEINAPTASRTWR
jgi:hypothetical protein